MRPHPLSEIFPPMEGDEFDALVEDIRRNGLRQPLVMYQGKILDGRNRWRACEKAGVKATTTDYRGNDPLGYVLSLNLNRRHLTPTQRAIVAENIVTTTHGGFRHGEDSRTKGSRDPLIAEVSREKAARIMDTSPGTMKRVRKVLDHGTEPLKAAIKADKLDAGTAAKLVDASAKTQKAAAEGGKEIAREIVKKIEAREEAKEEARSGDPPVKTLGLPIPPEILVRIEKEQGLLDKMSRMLSELKRTYTEYEQCTGVAGKLGPGKHHASALRSALDALNTLRDQRPACVCPHCKLLPDLIKTCNVCRRSGYIGASALKQIEACLLVEGDEAGVWVDGKWRSLAELRGDDF
jgi:ParB-like chromosome segregation protein Spo0J